MQSTWSLSLYSQFLICTLQTSRSQEIQHSDISNIGTYLPNAHKSKYAQLPAILWRSFNKVLDNLKTVSFTFLVDYF